MRHRRRTADRSSFVPQKLESRLFFTASPTAGVVAFDPATLVPGSFDTTRILVKLKDGVTTGSLKPAAGTALGEKLSEASNTVEVRLGKGIGVAAALAAYAKNPVVEYAEPNWKVASQVVPDDEFYQTGYMWGLGGNTTSPASTYGSQAAEAWAAGDVGVPTSGGPVYVGIIDEGIDYHNVDLAPNVWTNAFDPADGRDNDGNGYVDDVHGWDFYNDDSSVYDGGGDDHGTHVAGTIAAKGNDDYGVPGMSWGVKYISAKFLGPDGGYTSDVVRALDYFVDLKTRHGMNIVATNNSWGGGGFELSLRDAITRAARADILFVAAAGNGNSIGVGQNNDSVASYPSNYNTTSTAGYDSVIAVAAIAENGSLAGFSNYGRTTVDLAAPGVSILSTVPDDYYSFYSGTSMATPHVTGAIALYAAKYPNATAAEIRAAILDSAVATASVATKTVTGGRLDVSAALKIAPTAPVVAPDAPTGLSAAGTSTSTASLSWVDVADDETAYRVERSVAGGSFATVATLGANANSYVDTGLAAATTYTYRVRAERTDGGVVTPSGYSNTATATTDAAVVVTPVVGTGTGLRGDYYDNMLAESTTSASAYTLSGWKFARTDATVNANYGTGAPSQSGVTLGSDSFVIKWTGLVEPKYTDAYTFRFDGDNGVGAWITVGGVRTPLWTPTWDHLDGKTGNRTSTEYAVTSAYESAALNLTAGTKYPIEVVYYEYTGSASAKLQWRSATHQSLEVIPKTQLYQGPSALTATAASSSSIRLTWADNATGEDGFKIERSADNVNWGQVGSVGANVTSWTNTGLTANKTYYFRLRAYNNTPAYKSAYSNTATTKTLAATAFNTSTLVQPRPAAVGVAGAKDDDRELLRGVL